MSEYQYQVVGYLQQLVKIDISKGDVVEGNVVELLTSLRDDIPIDVHYATFVDILNTETAELRQRISELEAENARIIRYAIYPHEKKCMQCNGHSIDISNTEHPNYCSRCDGTGYEIITHASANEEKPRRTLGTIAQKYPSVSWHHIVVENDGFRHAHLSGDESALALCGKQINWGLMWDDDEPVEKCLSCETLVKLRTSANETEEVHTTGRYNPATGEIEIDPHEQKEEVE